MVEPASLTIATAADLIESRELSPVDLTQACLDRIDSLQDQLNAFITVLDEQALRQAREAEAQIQKGRYLGPLHGIPVGLKDLFDVAGAPTTAGSKVFAERVAREDSAVVARLKAAGAIIIGKHNLHEFGFGATNLSSYFGPTRNPWDLSRISGGSSGGSAIAVVTGQCLGAIGTDTGGSIRIPAALSGVVGVKPTYGLVSRKGIPLSRSLDYAGPLTRTALDSALLMNAIAGYDQRDPASVETPETDYTSGIDDGVSGLKIGIPRAHFYEGADAEVLRAVEGAVGILTELGATTQEVEVPSISYLDASFIVIMMSEATALHLPLLRERADDYMPDARRRLEAGVLFSATEYVQAQRVRAKLTEEALEMMRQVDVLVTPTTPIPATTQEESSRSIEATRSLNRCTAFFNVTGLPAMSVPCGFTADGLPVAFQVAARPFQDATALRVAHTYQKHTDWHERRPPL